MIFVNISTILHVINRLYSRGGRNLTLLALEPIAPLCFVSLRNKKIIHIVMFYYNFDSKEQKNDIIT